MNEKEVCVTIEYEGKSVGSPLIVKDDSGVKCYKMLVRYDREIVETYLVPVKANNKEVREMIRLLGEHHVKMVQFIKRNTIFRWNGE